MSLALLLAAGAAVLGWFHARGRLGGVRIVTGWSAVAAAALALVLIPFVEGIAPIAFVLLGIAVAYGVGYLWGRTSRVAEELARPPD